MRFPGPAMALVAAVVGMAPVHARAGHAETCDGGDAASCRYIVQATRDLTRMLTTGDPAPLRRHLDSRALWISAEDVRSGAQLVDIVRKDGPRATATLDSVRARFFDDVAIVVWAESWTAPQAAVPDGRLTGVDTWVRRRGRWRIVSSVENQRAR